MNVEFGWYGRITFRGTVGPEQCIQGYQQFKNNVQYRKLRNVR
jgi:hypothetical protein